MDRKEKILIAASRVFRKYGLNKTKLSDIGRESGYNSSSLYYYFKNKDDLLQQMVLYDIEKIKKALKMSLQDINNMKSGLKNYLMTRVEQMDIINRYEEMLQDSVMSPSLRKFFRKIEKELRIYEYRLLENFILKCSKKHAKDATVITNLVLGVSMKLTVARMLDRYSLDRIEKMVDQTVKFLLRES